MTNYIERIFMCLFFISISSLVKCLFNLFLIFIGLLTLLFQIFWEFFIYSVIKLFITYNLQNNFCQFVAYVFLFLTVYWREVYNFDESSYSALSIINWNIGAESKKFLPNLRSQKLPSMSSFRYFILSKRN